MSSDFKEPLDFGVLLGLAYGRFVQQLQQHLIASGFGGIGRSFGYIFRLLDKKNHSLREVADQLAITPQGALKIIEEMIANGYVMRKADKDDARVKQLQLTKLGKQALQQARSFHQKFEANLANNISKADVAKVRKVLEQMIEKTSDNTLEAIGRFF